MTECKRIVVVGTVVPIGSVPEAGCLVIVVGPVTDLDRAAIATEVKSVAAIVDREELVGSGIATVMAVESPATVEFELAELVALEAAPSVPGSVVVEVELVVLVGIEHVGFVAVFAFLELVWVRHLGYSLLVCLSFPSGASPWALFLCALSFLWGVSLGLLLRWQ